MRQQIDKRKDGYCNKKTKKENPEPYHKTQIDIEIGLIRSRMEIIKRLLFV